MSKKASRSIQEKPLTFVFIGYPFIFFSLLFEVRKTCLSFMSYFCFSYLQWLMRMDPATGQGTGGLQSPGVQRAAWARQ